MFLERKAAEPELALCDEGKLESIEGVSQWLQIKQPERIDARIVKGLVEAG